MNCIWRTSWARAGLGGDRVIFEQEPGWDEHQGVLVWSDELGPPAQSVEGVRSFIIKRVAQDLIRRRIERLAVASFGGESEITVNQFELGGRVELMQWVVQREGTDERSWNETVALLLRPGRPPSLAITTSRGSASVSQSTRARVTTRPVSGSMSNQSECVSALCPIR